MLFQQKSTFLPFAQQIQKSFVHLQQKQLLFIPNMVQIRTSHIIPFNLLTQEKLIVFIFYQYP